MRNSNLTKIALILFIALASVGLKASELYARGGGGCLIQGTPVLTPGGMVPIERLREGDTVIGVSDNATIPVTVRSTMRVLPKDAYEIVIGKHTLYITAEHPVEIKPGTFRQVSFLKVGDTIILKDLDGLKPAVINAISPVMASKLAYNILVSPAGTYIANDVVVHNKGCFLPETPIRRTDGTEISISKVKRHDRLLAFTADGKIVQTTVRKVLTHEVNEYCIVKAGNTVLNVTKEHPFYVGNGEFKTLEALKVGDHIFVFDGNVLSPQQIDSIKNVQAKVLVYNLQTDAPNTFFAHGAAVHNKGGGCFPARTMVKTPAGDVAIEHLKVGDAVIAIDHDGQPILTHIKETHITQSPLLLIATTHGTLKTTREHPIALASGGFRPADELSPDVEILTWKDNQCAVAFVTDKAYSTPLETVYNLTVDWPHTFIADGFIVHNKGGGFGGGFHGGGGHHGGSSSGDIDDFIQYTVNFLIIFGVVYYVIDAARGGFKKKNLDFLFDSRQVQKKSEKTVKLLAFIAQQDDSVEPDHLKRVAELTFLKLQNCWQARDYSPMKPLLMPDLYQAHSLEIEGMIRNHEINIIADLKIDKIDLVNIRYTSKEEQREFTALITATAQDYYIDDRTQARLRGDDSPAQFQEFWTFHYMNKSWLLRDIEQTGESNILKEENFFEQFTDKSINHIYGDSASKEGPTGPWLEKESESKDTRIERMLNFLSKTDKIWDRDTMLFTTRRVFLEFMMAWESGEESSIPNVDLFPEFASSLKEEVARDRAVGITREFRNLCVRKVELVLVRNFADNSKDEFVARVRAHAQKIMRNKETILHRDDDVTPFEQFLTFGRLENKWKLKEIVTAETGQKLMRQENLDQDSTPQQLKWYYQHKRAI